MAKKKRKQDIEVKTYSKVDKSTKYQKIVEKYLNRRK